jgi:YesN/AraC family two-component response regulator
VTDVVMPQMNGRDLARKLNVLFPDLKRLFMSGYPDAAIARQGALEEGIDYIQKPFSIVELADKVREILDMK